MSGLSRQVMPGLSGRALWRMVMVTFVPHFDFLSSRHGLLGKQDTIIEQDPTGKIKLLTSFRIPAVY
jgi:hypothetical protein